MWQGSLPGVLYSDCNEIPWLDMWVFYAAVQLIFFFKRSIAKCIPTVFMIKVTSRKNTYLWYILTMLTIMLTIPMAVAGAEEVGLC